MDAMDMTVQWACLDETVVTVAMARRDSLGEMVETGVKDEQVSEELQDLLDLVANVEK